jgi:hypothetical protein
MVTKIPASFCSVPPHNVGEKEKICSIFYSSSDSKKKKSHVASRPGQQYLNIRRKQRKKKLTPNLKGVNNMPTENKKCVCMWLDRDLVDAIDRYKISKRFPTRKYLIENVLWTYMNHVEIEEGSVR